MKITRTPRFGLWAALCAVLFGCPLFAAVRITPEDPASVQRGIEEAFLQGAAKVVIPPGQYRLPSLPKAPCHLLFTGGHGLEIDATGVTLIATDREKPLLRFQNCHDVVFRGATLLRQTIPFSQGHIEAIEENGKSLIVRIAAGYPTEIDDPRLFPKVWLNLFDAQTRRWKRDLFSDKPQSVERLGPDLFRFYPRDKSLGSVAVGDLASWRGKGVTDIDLAGCAKMKISGVTIRNGGGFCVVEEGGEGDNYYNYTVTYGPKPAGAKEEPLMSSNADGFHSSRVRKGPTLEGCVLEGMDDDGFPIHGAYALVMESAGNTVVIDSRGGTFCRPGDRIRLINEAGAITGEAVAAKLAPLPAYQPKQTVPPDFRTYQDPKAAHYEELTLDRNVSLPFAGMLANENACGAGFTIRNCVVRNNRGRGMLIKASDGVIEGCTVEGSTMGGIVVAPEMGWWNEADFAHHLVIRNNTVRNASTWPSLAACAQCGAITLAAFEHRRFIPLPGGHRDIVIQGNTLEDNNGPNIVISSAADVEVKGNRFIRPMREKSDHGSAIGINPAALIWITETEHIALSGNTVQEPGPAFEKFIETTSSVRQMTGFDDGVQLR